MDSEEILQRRMHGLYLSRTCDDLRQLAHELLGLHCWFHRNITFSAAIRGAGLSGWKTDLTKTWLYRGTLHGVVYEDLPQLLAIHAAESHLDGEYLEIAEKAINLMEDGVYSRAEMRIIFADYYSPNTIEMAFSSWGGIFVELARVGRVAFRDMTSRDFDLIEATPTQSCAEVLPELFRRFIAAYGPATIDDAAWFFGLLKERKKELTSLNLDEYSFFKQDGNTYYYLDNFSNMSDIPKVTLLSGFDPIIVSYVNRSAVLPAEYKKAVIAKSGICLPTVAVNGKVAGIWNIKKNQPTVEFFTSQPKKIKDKTYDLLGELCYKIR